MGRPSKLTPNIQKLIIEGLRLGLTYSKTAELAGITRQTLSTWIKKCHEAESGPFFDFFNALSRAEAEGEWRNLKKIQETAIGGQENISVVEYYKDNTLIRKVIKTVKSPPNWRAALSCAWPVEWRSTAT